MHDFYFGQKYNFTKHKYDDGSDMILSLAFLDYEIDDPMSDNFLYFHPTKGYRGHGNRILFEADCGLGVKNCMKPHEFLEKLYSGEICVLV